MRTPTFRPLLRLIVVTALAGMVAAACGADDSALRTSGGDDPALRSAGGEGTVQSDRDGPERPAPVEGHTFHSQAVLVDGAPTALVAGSTITITFADGRLRAQAGCNQLAGGYRLDGDVLRVEDLSTTEMGCDPALMDQDQWLADQLTAGPVLALQGETLTLRSGGTEIVLVDEQVEGATAAAPLEGTDWVLDTLFEGESASSLPAGVTATIRIEDATLTVNGGCNSGGGSVAVEGSRLRVGDVVTTQKACSADAMRVEQHLLAVLGASPLFSVDAGQLRLDTGTGKGVGFRLG